MVDIDAQGLCFSPNNRFIYVTTAENVYQIDIEENNEVYHVGYYRSFDIYGWPVINHHLPNLPQYRYLTGCDSSIVFPFETSAVEQVLDKMEFKIYPNPATDYIKVVLTKMDKWQRWQILDLAGRLMSTGQSTDMQKIDISGLNPGMYILKVSDREGNVGIGKFVVE